MRPRPAPARAAPRARRRAPPSDPRGRSRRRNPRAQWLIYKTDQAAEFRRLEALQLWLMAAMCGSDVEALTAAPQSASAPTLLLEQAVHDLFYDAEDELLRGRVHSQLLCGEAHPHVLRLQQLSPRRKTSRR